MNSFYHTCAMEALSAMIELKEAVSVSVSLLPWYLRSFAFAYGCERQFYCMRIGLVTTVY